MSVMSTKMELSKEVEKILNKARSLNLRNETHFRNIKPTSSASIEASSGILVKNRDDECDLDIIDVNLLDLSDDETWLSLPEKPSNIKNIYQWLRRDIDEMKDVRYQTQQLLLQYEMTCLNTTMNSHIDSRTFTRPKKKITRPSLESVNSTFKYTYKNSQIDETNSYSPSSPYQNDSLKLSNAKREVPTVLKDFYRSDTDDFVTNKTSETQTNSNSSKNVKLIESTESSTSIEDIIREQMKILEIRDTYKTDSVDLVSKIKSFEQNDSVQNASPPPTFMMNSFGSSNFTSLTESDFITAVNQPQDLYTSYTSTIAAEEQNEIAQNFTENETFAKDIHNMCETFCNDIQDRTFTNSNSNSESNNINNDTFIAVNEEDALEKTFNKSSPNYFKKQNLINDSGPEAITYENKRDTVKAENLNNTFVHNIPINVLSPQLRHSNESNLNTSRESCRKTPSEKDFDEIDQNRSHSESVNNTFIKLSCTNKISQSDPNLLDQKSDENLLNQTFELSKTYQSHDLSDSLELTSSYSSLNSNKAANHDEFEQTQVIQGIKNTFRVRGESTPNIKNLTFKKTWASTEALSPISNLTTRDLLKIKQSSSETTRSMPTATFVKNIKSDTKTSHLLDKQIKRPLRHFERPNSTYKKIESVNSVKDAHIPTPMEVKRCTPPTPDHSTEVKNQNGTSNRQSMLRQPAARSGLPRPSSSATMSGIPRPQSRLPVPRSLRPPTNIGKPTAPIKNNWMDGCY